MRNAEPVVTFQERQRWPEGAVPGSLEDVVLTYLPTSLIEIKASGEARNSGVEDNQIHKTVCDFEILCVGKELFHDT